MMLLLYSMPIRKSFIRRFLNYRSVYLFINLQRCAKLFRNISNVLYLRRILAGNDFDILHTLLFHNGFWVRLVAPRRFDQRIIYSIRNDLRDGPSFYLSFEKLLIRRSYAITNSLKAMEQFKVLVGEKYHHKISNIYNGFDVKRFILDEPPPIGNEILIGTVGRQTAQKNQIQILEAIKRISGKYLFHFFLIGDKANDRSEVNENYVMQNGLNELCYNLRVSTEDRILL